MDYVYDDEINLEEKDRVEIIRVFPDTIPVRVAYMKNLTKNKQINDIWDELLFGNVEVKINGLILILEYVPQNLI